MNNIYFSLQYMFTTSDTSTRVSRERTYDLLVGFQAVKMAYFHYIIGFHDARELLFNLMYCSIFTQLKLSFPLEEPIYRLTSVLLLYFLTRESCFPKIVH